MGRVIYVENIKWVAFLVRNKLEKQFYSYSVIRGETCRVYQGFRLNLSKRVKIIVLGHFCPLLKQEVFFWAVVKNASRLNDRTKLSFSKSLIRMEK